MEFFFPSFTLKAYRTHVEFAAACILFMSLRCVWYSQFSEWSCNIRDSPCTRVALFRKKNKSLFIILKTPSIYWQERHLVAYSINLWLVGVCLPMSREGGSFLSSYACGLSLLMYIGDLNTAVWDLTWYAMWYFHVKIILAYFLLRKAPLLGWVCIAVWCLPSEWSWAAIIDTKSGAVSVL